MVAPVTWLGGQGDESRQPRLRSPLSRWIRASKKDSDGIHTFPKAFIGGVFCKLLLIKSSGRLRVGFSEISQTSRIAYFILLCGIHCQGEISPYPCKEEISRIRGKKEFYFGRGEDFSNDRKLKQFREAKLMKLERSAGDKVLPGTRKLFFEETQRCPEGWSPLAGDVSIHAPARGATYK